MLRLILISLFYLIILLPLYGSNIDNIQEAIKQAEEELAQVKKANDELASQIMNERQALQKQLAHLRTKIEKLNKRRTYLNEEISKLSAQTCEFEGILPEGASELEIFKARLKDAATILHGILHNSLVSIQFPQLYSKISNLITTEAYSDDYTYMNAILTIALYDIKESSKISVYEGEVFRPDGTAVRGKIIRLGKIGAAFREADKQAELLYFSPTVRRLFIAEGSLNWRFKLLLTNYFKHSQDCDKYKSSKDKIMPVPIDLTGGAVLTRPKVTPGIVEKIYLGGICMIPILGIGFIALIIIIERLIVLNRTYKQIQFLMPTVIELIKASRLAEAEKVCLAHPGVASRILLAGLKNKDNSKESLEEAFQAAILHELPRLERFLPALAVFGTIQPLLGLLGTVLGLIKTFEIITLFGVGEPRLMSGGISEALITTQYGLMFAIPIILFHHYLSGRVDKIISEIEKNAVTLINLIKPT